MSLETMIRDAAARRAAEAPEPRAGWSEVQTAIHADAARRPARIALKGAAIAAAVLAVAVIGPKITGAPGDTTYRPTAFTGSLPSHPASVPGGTLDGVEYRLVVRASTITMIPGPDTIDHRCVKMSVDYDAPDPLWTTGNIVVGHVQDCAVLEGRSAIGALHYRPFPHRHNTPYHALGVVAPRVVRLSLMVDGATMDVPTHPVAGFPLRAWIADIATGARVTEMIGHLDDGTRIVVPVNCHGEAWPTCTNGVDPDRTR